MTRLLKNRLLAGILLGTAAAQLGLTACHLPGWSCPLFKATGIPCPGCGLTRATLALFAGNWRQGLTIHAFAIFMPLALVLISIALLPTHYKQKFIVQVEKFEARTNIIGILLFGLVAYWVVRILFFHEILIRCVNS